MHQIIVVMLATAMFDAHQISRLRQTATVFASGPKARPLRPRVPFLLGLFAAPGWLRALTA